MGRRRQVRFAAHEQRVNVAVELFRRCRELLVLALERLDRAADGGRLVVERVQVALGLANVLVHHLDRVRFQRRVHQRVHVGRDERIDLLQK